MEGSRTSWGGGAGPSFSNDTLRPVEFLPDKASILERCKHVPERGMRPDAQMGANAQTRQQVCEGANGEQCVQ